MKRTRNRGREYLRQQIAATEARWNHAAKATAAKGARAEAEATAAGEGAGEGGEAALGGSAGEAERDGQGTDAGANLAEGTGVRMKATADRLRKPPGAIRMTNNFFGVR